jgi:hypothetical protein
MGILGIPWESWESEIRRFPLEKFLGIEDFLLKFSEFLIS